MFRVNPLFIADKIIYAFESSLEAKFIQFRVCVSYSEAHTFIFIFKLTQNTPLSGSFLAQSSIKLQLPTVEIFKLSPNLLSIDIKVGICQVIIKMTYTGFVWLQLSLKS